MTAGLLERPLIVGARGQLGRDLVAALADRHPVAPGRASADLEDAGSLAATLERERPSVVINAAAFTDVELCESRPDRAFAVNALGVDALARLCAAAEVPFATVSTDYVFDGKAAAPYDERDAPGPINAYGISKLAGELLTHRHGARWFIFRTSGLYGIGGSAGKPYTFVDRILERAARGEPLRVVDDVTFSPSYSPHVAAAIRRVLEAGRFGLYHVTNAGECTWYEFASAALAGAGVDAPIERIGSRDYPSAVARPSYSALAHGELARAGIADLPGWRAGLGAYLARRSAAPSADATT